MSDTIFITRKQYDFLVQNCASWMQLRWSEYRKQWSLGGVAVSGNASQIENLICQLDSAPVQQ